MNKNNWKTFVIWIVICNAVGALSGWLSMEGTELYAKYVQQPPFSPPSWVFPVVWTILYTLMGISAARAMTNGQNVPCKTGFLLFVAQLTVNFFWPLIFFNAQAYGAALVWLLLLWALVLLTILQFRKCDKLSAILLVPYLIWLTFAVYLNAAVWVINR